MFVHSFKQPGLYGRKSYFEYTELDSGDSREVQVKGTTAHPGGQQPPCQAERARRPGAGQSRLPFAIENQLEEWKCQCVTASSSWRESDRATSQVELGSAKMTRDLARSGECQLMHNLTSSPGH
jgi:hypothetical protein